MSILRATSRTHYSLFVVGVLRFSLLTVDLSEVRQYE